MKIKIHIFGLTLFFMFALSSCTFATTYVIHPDGSGDFPTIQAGIDTAVEGDTIELTDGIFMGRGNMDISYLGKAITVCSQSGNADACIIDVEGEYNMESQRGFLFTSGEDSASILRDIKIINAVADDFCPNCDGGGVFVENSSPTIINVIFENNFASGGGGLAVLHGSATVIDCRFVANEAFSGSGFFCMSNSAPVTFNYCQFSGNSATLSGGGIYAENGGLFEIINCTLSDNDAEYGGGIRLWDSEALIENTIISFSNPGEAVNLYGSSTILISYSDFYGNDGGDWTEPIDDLLGVDGNICEDPFFIDSDNGNYHFLPESPCIDAGNPESPYDPDSTICDMGAFYYDQQVNVDNSPEILPEKISLSQNYPNPFNASTLINYSLSRQSQVMIEIYNILGRKVETLIQGEQPAGYHQITWDAKSRSSGMYFYRIQTGKYTETRKMVLLK